MVLQFQCAIDTEKREDTSIITNLHDNGQTVIPTHVVPTFFVHFVTILTRKLQTGRVLRHQIWCFKLSRMFLSPSSAVRNFFRHAD